jgi:hypothetical protein
MYYETFINLVLILSLLPVFFTAGASHDLFFDEEKREPRINWKPLIVLLVILVFYRVVLSIGIRFGG